MACEPLSTHAFPPVPAGPFCDDKENATPRLTLKAVFNEHLGASVCFQAAMQPCRSCFQAAAAVCSYSRLLSAASRCESGSLVRETHFWYAI